MADTFCGWYYRCQSEEHTVALIPAVHTVQGVRSGSLQIIGGTGSRMLTFPGEISFAASRRPRAVLGQNVFSESGIRLNETREDVSIRGELRFGRLSPLRCDIMGPFCCVPLMECRHSVASMRHTVNGSLWINGTESCFQDSAGYLEGDRGRSFPRRYAWTQCFFDGGSLMLSVADIPLGGLQFTGIIGIVRMGGEEVRLATYLGAQAETIRGGEIIIRQGKLSLSAALLEKNAHTLKAPKAGAMTRSIREGVACRARYCLRNGTQTVLSFETDRAAFEFEYPELKHELAYSRPK